MNVTFGFIGCGNMGGALAAAVARSAPNAKLLLCDACAEKAASLALALGAEATDLEAVALQSDHLFLGVKPQTLPALFETLTPLLSRREVAPVLISMAAGISLSTLSGYVGEGTPIIRIMPNMPASVGEGMILYTPNASVSEPALAVFLAAMSGAGMLDRIDEEKIDAASALSGCGPAFVYLFAEALADGAVACGLPRDKALLYASQTLAGASKMLLETGMHPAALKDAVCSPGGTTIEGVKALEDGAFRAATMQAVIAAYEKTLKMGKK